MLEENCLLNMINYASKRFGHILNEDELDQLEVFSLLIIVLYSYFCLILTIKNSWMLSKKLQCDLIVLLRTRFHFFFLLIYIYIFIYSFFLQKLPGEDLIDELCESTLIKKEVLFLFCFIFILL